MKTRVHIGPCHMYQLKYSSNSKFVRLSFIKVQRDHEPFIDYYKIDYSSNAFNLFMINHNK